MTTAQATLQRHSVYVANMRALYQRWPRFAYEIDRVDESDAIECEPSRSGAITCRLEGYKGTSVYLHSRYDPQQESQRWADGVEELAANQEESANGQIVMCYIVDGFGLGYHIKALFDRLAGDAFIVVCEQNIAMLHSAFLHFDYSQMLSSGRVIFIIRADRDEVLKKLEPLGNMMMMGTVLTRPLVQRDREFCSEVHKLIGEFTSYMRSHLSSLLCNSITTCGNVLRNLEVYVSTPTIGRWKGRFAGCPAVLVAAGPSLRNSLEVLKEIRDRVVVIAVQTTLKPLLEYGIVPDFVTSLDYHDICLRFFEGLNEDDLRGIVLIAEPKANWQVVDYYHQRGEVSLLGNEFARLLLCGSDGHDVLKAGATVAHLSFYWAEYIGADPIMLVGQDLGYTNNVYYSPGTALHGIWANEFNRFCTAEMKEWERIARSRGMLRKIEDIDGGMIYTDEQMFTYLQQFEKDFANANVRVIDATSGGVKKKGCEVMSLAQAGKLYCGDVIDCERFDIDGNVVGDAAKKREAARECVQKRIDEAKEMLEIMDETIELLSEMSELVDDQDAMARKMVRVDELRAMVNQKAQVYRLITYVSQDAELLRFREDRSLGVDSVQGKARQRRQLRRDVAYVSQLRVGCKRLIEMLSEKG